MEALNRETIYTIDDVYILPNGQRAELLVSKISYTHKPLDLPVKQENL